MSEDRKADDTTLPPLPLGWAWAKVDEVGEVKLGRQRSPEHHTGTHMRPYLRVANVYEDRIDLSSVLEMNFTPQEFETYQLRAGDILLNEGQSLELVGRPALYRDELPGACFQNTLVRFRTGPALEPRFALAVFRYYLHSKRFQKLARWTVNIAHLGASRFAEVEFPLPPLAEQRRVVERLDELFSDLDAGVAALVRARANLKKYRAAVLKAAVTGELTKEWRANHPSAKPATKLLDQILAERRRRWEEVQQEKFASAGKSTPKEWQSKYQEPAPPDTNDLPQLPPHWCWASVDQVAEPGEQPVMTGPFGSMLGREDFLDTGIPLLTIGCLTEAGITLDKACYISDEKAQELSRYTVREGDLLFSRSASVGRVGYVTKALAGSLINYHIMRLRLADSVLLPNYFVSYVRGAGEVRSYLRKVNHGATRDGINSESLLSMPVAIPPLDEQVAIVSEVDQQVSVIAAAEDYIGASLKRAERLRQGILKEAFAGRLVPQDPKDEPASVLLERMRQAHGTQGRVARHPRSRQKRGKAPLQSLFEGVSDERDE